jgi:ABC-type multidrug transport system permease subunit
MEKNPKDLETRTKAGFASQAWFGFLFWMSMGLLFEGLIGFRAPVYLQDPVRRELFRLAHAHGTLLCVMLLIINLYLVKGLVSPPKLAIRALQAGTIIMPLGFLLGGAWHYESDPGLLIFLAPVGALLVIFGVMAIAFSSLKK